MKESLYLLGGNSNCKTLIIKKAGHDFSMRNAEHLNRILVKFINSNNK